MLRLIQITVAKRFDGGTSALQVHHHLALSRCLSTALGKVSASVVVELLTPRIQDVHAREEQVDFWKAVNFVLILQMCNKQLAFISYKFAASFLTNEICKVTEVWLKFTRINSC